MKVRTDKKKMGYICPQRKKTATHNSIKTRTTINVVKKKNVTKLLSKDSGRPLKNKSGNLVTDDADILLTPWMIFFVSQSTSEAEGHRTAWNKFSSGKVKYEHVL